MITWNHTLKVKYENLFVLAEITRVQCISTANCKRAFSVQNCIKTKQRNRMLTKNLESILRVALEGHQYIQHHGETSIFNNRPSNQNKIYLNI